MMEPGYASAAPQPAVKPVSSTRVAVACRNLTKSFGSGESEVLALRGVDLEVLKGELLMLVGPSGCGKTTLISVIAGILDRTGGECTVMGRDHSVMSPAQRTEWRAHNIGFVFQAFNLLPALSAEENVAVPLLICGVRKAAALKRAAAMLERVGLSGKGRALPNELSGGQQQRVAIARALVHQPKLVVCDEPTSALDADSGQRVLELFRDVGHSEDRALIIVTHDSRIFSFADRITELSDGRVKPADAPLSAFLPLH
jgi:putative ABC transport system ATP-binding protein